MESSSAIRPESDRLFETEGVKGRVIYRWYAGSILVGICLIWIYRATHTSADDPGRARWAWMGMLAAELWFGFYWVLTQALRWNRVNRRTFKDRLSQRYDKVLPWVDIFVCTADAVIEPPIMVINTVLSVMSYNYPTQKLSVYLSDDGASDLTYYALFEASLFVKHWIPYCNEFNIEPRSPAAYFNSISSSASANHHPHCNSQQFLSIQALYQEMESRIQSVTRLGHIPDDILRTNKGFSDWDSSTSPQDHDTILQILIDGRDEKACDVEGNRVPTLVYLAREKRPQHPHNFKAGAMNALIRVSSQISNGDVILNVDCDMYSNNSESVRDALCFFMDPEKGTEVAFVQFPQHFDNVTRNELYSSSLRVIAEVEFQGLDGYGGPLYIGSGCFHRRDTLCGRKFNKDCKIHWNNIDMNSSNTKLSSVDELEAKSKPLASSTCEENTQWGKEMGLRYGCPVEDVITGLSIQSQGWKSVYCNPERRAFLGLAPTTLPQTLVQHKRWSEGDLLILLSKYSPAWSAYGNISLGLRLGYCCYCLWAPNCLATLYYSIVPSLYLLKGVSLFPQLSSPWLLPFAYVIFSKYICSFVEFLWSGGTILGWWNDQRIWLYKRTSSYLFALLDTFLNKMGFSDSGFVITAKVTEQDVSQRYGKEMMEFGISTPMFTILSTLALLNLFCFVQAVKEAAIGEGLVRVCEEMVLQVLLSGFLLLINLPLYQALFFRSDKGKLPASLALKSTAVALSACVSSLFLQ